MQNDPYSTPVANPYGASTLAGSSSVSTAAVQQLAATKPWVRLISVMIFIGAGLMLIAAIVMAVMGAVGTASGGNGVFASVGVGFGMAAAYGLFSILYIFPGVKLWKYASCIGRLIQSGQEEDLIAALNNQRSFWKFMGVLVIIMAALYLLIILGIALTAGVAASQMK